MLFKHNKKQVKGGFVTSSEFDELFRHRITVGKLWMI